MQLLDIHPPKLKVDHKPSESSCPAVSPQPRPHARSDVYNTQRDLGKGYWKEKLEGFLAGVEDDSAWGTRPVLSRSRKIAPLVKPLCHDKVVPLWQEVRPSRH